MSTTNTAIHPILQTLIHLAPTIRDTFFNNVTISISDTETVLYQLDCEELKGLGNNVGLVLTAADPMYNVMRSKKKLQLAIGKEHYGMAIRAAVVPIFDENKRVIGSMGISRSIKDQTQLIEISEAFASSSEELIASSTELSSAATYLSNTIHDVTDSQRDLSQQVADSTRILDIINNVAKNTRILGFNAGIEAARSGEHGKGFAVVAKEITKLADQSAHSVNEIRHLLDTMKEKVDHVSTIINGTLQLTEQQVHTTAEITKAISQLTDVASQIDALAHKL